MPIPVVVVSMFAYLGLSTLVLNLIIPEIGRNHRELAAIIFIIAWGFGWIWLIGSLALGSLRGGVYLLRWWIAIYGGLAFSLAPFAFLPHTATLILGILLGVAFGSYVATGKAHWIL